MVMFELGVLWVTDWHCEMDGWVTGRASGACVASVAMLLGEQTSVTLK